MKLSQYLKLIKHTQFSVICAIAVKDEHSPFYHSQYKTWPLQTTDEYLRHVDEMDSNETLIVLNPHQAPIEWSSGACWTGWFNHGRIEGILVIKEEDFKLLCPSEEQRQDMERYIDEKIMDYINTKKGVK